MTEIQVFNFAFDEDRELTRVIYKGREAAIAQEFGRLLRYTNKGRKLVAMITGVWADRFREGIDYEILKGHDLQDFKKLVPSEVTSAHTPQLMILYTSGIHLILLNTEKPVGTKLHQWLADTVFPSLAKTGSFSLPGAEKYPLPDLAYMIRQFQVALNKIKNARLAADGATKTQFRQDWTALHYAHTQLHKWEMENRAMERGLKGWQSMSWAELIRHLQPLAAATEANHIDLERIGLPPETAKAIATTEYKAYAQRILEAGIDPSAILARGEIR